MTVLQTARLKQTQRGVRRLAVLAAALVLASAALGIWLIFSTQAAYLQNELSQRSHQELIRHALRRLEGHPKFEWALHPLLFATQRYLERDPPPDLPTLGKGQIASIKQSMRDIKQVWPVDTPQTILKALNEATPGTYIEIAPGLYPFTANLLPKNSGQVGEPIVLGAKQPGTVWLIFQQMEGIIVRQPHWIFENLNLRGDCVNHNYCEHAFHIVAGARGTILRNNFITDFNAHIKVNGERGLWPDNGLVEHNTLTLSKPRNTSNPVVAFDLVGANGWRVSDNLVKNIVNSGGNRIAYGLYMKGGSSNGLFERNLVICSTYEISRPGNRVGISFGGGNTGHAYCRDSKCTVEHDGGSAINNIVAHCNDSGIDINKSINTLVLHNTLINTTGITSRHSPSQAKLRGNLMDGKVLSRDGSIIDTMEDADISARSVYRDADAFDLVWKSAIKRIARSDQAPTDFFQNQRAPLTTPGATAPL